jgi:hypothetical protein
VLSGGGPTPAPVLNVGTLADATPTTDNAAEEVIAIDPTNPNNLFVGANDLTIPGAGTIAAFSHDGGATWQSRVIGTGTDGLPPSIGDPTVAWDDFGNLYYGYVNFNNTNEDDVLISTDGGENFSLGASVVDPNASVLDQPSIAVGPGPGGKGQALWIAIADFLNNGAIPEIVAGAPILGRGQVGAFGPFATIANSDPSNFNSIAVGPLGQVAVVYQSYPGFDPDMNGQLFVTVNEGGLATPQAFSAPKVIANMPTAVFGRNGQLPAQPGRGITMKGGLAWDRSPGPNHGRLYVIYANSPSLDNPNTDIYVQTSDNDGKGFSTRVKVNDDTTNRSQFFPRIAVDQSTGTVAASWHDARNDAGQGGPNDANGTPNDDTEFFAAVSFNGGKCWTQNVQLTPFASSTSVNPDIVTGGGEFDYGDYTGLAFEAGVFHPAWADDSASLAGLNPAPPAWNIGTVGVRTPQILAYSDAPFELNETSERATQFGALTPGTSEILENAAIENHANGLPDYDWYRWTAGATGTVTARIGDLAGSGPLELHLFTVNGAGTLIPLRQVNVAAGDCSLNALVAVSVNAGEPVLVEVKGANTSPGTFGTGGYDLLMNLT